MQAEITLLVIFAVALVGKNPIVATAAGVTILVKISGLGRWLVFFEDYGIDLGILLMTLAILVPIADGKITVAEIWRTLISRKGLVTIGVGALAAFLAGRGTEFLKIRPDIMVGLIIGTIAGAMFLGGVPCGPLMAAGIAAYLTGLLK